MAVIILEGENKTGKSTLAKHIVKTYGFEYIPSAQPQGDPHKEYSAILDKIQSTGKDFVLDRFCHGEFVYGPIYRGESGMELVQLLDLEMRLKTQMNTVLIHCYDTYDNIKERFISEDEEFATTDKIKETLWRFENILKLSSLTTFKHHMSSEGDLFKNYLIDRIVEELMGIDKHQRQLKELQSENAFYKITNDGKRLQ